MSNSNVVLATSIVSSDLTMAASTNVTSEGDVTTMWLLYIVALLFATTASVLVVYHRQASHGSALVTLITSLTYAALMATLLLLPMDVAILNASNDQKSGSRRKWATPEKMADIEHIMRLVYAFVYAIDAVLCLVIIPFTYFWWEEGIEADMYDQSEEDAPPPNRLWMAIKYTVGFIFATSVLMSLGVLLPTPGFAQSSYVPVIPMKSVYKLVTFALGVSTLAGTVLYTLYTAIGLVYLPINLVSPIPSRLSAISNRLHRNKQRQRELLNAAATGTAISPNRALREIEFLMREERSLVRQERLAAQAVGSGIWLSLGNWLGWAVSPVRILLGLALALIAMGFSASVLVGALEVSTDVGFTSQPGNLFFQRVSNAPPADLVILVVILGFLFLASVSGMATIGIRFLWVRIFSFRAGKTSPQALLVGAELQAAITLAISYAMGTTFAPQYMTYGAQMVCTASVVNPLACYNKPELVVPCGETVKKGLLDRKYGDVCATTVLSQVLNQMEESWPFFSHTSLILQFVFVMVVSMALAVRVFRGRPTGLEVDEEDEREEELEEEERLLASHGERSPRRQEYGGTWQGISRRNRSRTLVDDGYRG